MRRIYSCKRHGLVSGEQKRFRCTSCVFSLVLCKKCVSDFGAETLNENLHLEMGVLASNMRCPSCLVEQKKGKRLSVGTLKPDANHQSKGRMENRECSGGQQDQEGSSPPPPSDKSKSEKA